MTEGPTEMLTMHYVNYIPIQWILYSKGIIGVNNSALIIGVSPFQSVFVQDSMEVGTREGGSYSLTKDCVQWQRPPYTSGASCASRSISTYLCTNSSHPRTTSMHFKYMHTPPCPTWQYKGMCIFLRSPPPGILLLWFKCG